MILSTDFDPCQHCGHMLSDVNLITCNVELLNLYNSFNLQIIYPLLNRKLDKVVFYWYQDIFVCVLMKYQPFQTPNWTLEW